MANKKKKGKGKQKGNVATSGTPKKEVIIDDETLFNGDPPPKEECPICLLPFGCSVSEAKYQECCGKLICCGCFLVGIKKGSGKTVENLPGNSPCPFCRSREPYSNAEAIMWTKKRIKENNDALACHRLSSYYRMGTMGLPKDPQKSIELLHRAAEMGAMGAHQNLGFAYCHGKDVEKDFTKAVYHYSVAAVGGITVARYNLGCMECQAGNVARGMKHLMISAMAGNDLSLDMIKKGYTHGDVTKEDFAKALRAHKDHSDEVKSYQRDKVTIRSTTYHEPNLTAEERLNIRGALRHASTALATTEIDPTPYVELKNMIVDDLTNDVKYQNLVVDTHNVCSKFGDLKMLIIPRCGPGAGSIFLEYMSAEDAARVVAALGGLDTGDGRKIEAVYCNPLALSMHNYMLSIQLYETQEVTAEMWQGMERN